MRYEQYESMQDIKERVKR